MIIERAKENPILKPNEDNYWESEAVFNGCPFRFGKKINILYRAMSPSKIMKGYPKEISTIGIAESNNGINFSKQRQLIKPEFDWEKYGCEDPRVTYLDGKYYIFYTALSTYPFKPEGIKIGLGLTKDFKKIEKHNVTPFNSKAMALFPEKINGKFVAILTVNTDNPPAKICISYFNKENEIWSENYWNNYYFSINDYILPLKRSEKDHVEVGSQPIKTNKGWLIIYAYIKNYFSNNKEFRIEAALLDLKDPKKILGVTKFPLLVPKEEYELYGKIPNVIFPSGAIVKGNTLYVYYGATDTTCCLARCKLNTLVDSILKPNFAQFKRIKLNPIIIPNKNHDWESKATFNPAAIKIDGNIHLVYRAMSNDNKSVLGYALIKKNYEMERLDKPIYTPKEWFEKQGCEDPRITRIKDTLYMMYTAYDGKLPRVTLTSIKVSDFLEKKWNWDKPIIISSDNIEDKNACLFPEKIKGKYVILHRINKSICINYINNLKFKEKLDFIAILLPRKNSWDNWKIGVSCPPIKTKDGWLLLYHGVSSTDHIYKVGIALLDLKNPSIVISRLDYPILEPELESEKKGNVNNVVFPCGATTEKDKLTIYYGGADKVINAATISIKKLLEELKNN